MLITNGTLHHYWLPYDPERSLYDGDSVHVDQISIPGATINDLFTAFWVDYGDESRGLDVVLAAGVDDIMQGKKTEHGFRANNMIEDLRWFKNSVVNKLPARKNTFAIATMVYPPKLCHLPDDGPMPPYFVNHLEMMKWINDQIKVINTESNLTKIPVFHTYGARVDKKHKTSKHRLGDWRGVATDEKLYLIDQNFLYRFFRNK